MKTRIMFAVAALATVTGVSLAAQEAALPSKEKAVLWVKADSLKMKDGEKVAVWKDESGKGNDLKAPEGNQPAFKEKGAADKPTVVFMKSYFDVKLPVKICTDAYSIFVMVSDSKPLYKTFVATDGYRFQTNNYSVKQVANIGYPDEETYPAIYEMIQSEKNGVVFIDGKQVKAVAGMPKIETTGFRIGMDGLSKIGSPDAFDGAISEIIIYKGELSEAERVKVEEYLKTKYGVK